MSFFGKNDKDESNWEVYVEKYLEGVERLYKVGGFSLTVFGVGIALMVFAAIGAGFSNAVAENLAALEALCLVILAMGIAIHFYKRIDCSYGSGATPRVSKDALGRISSKLQRRSERCTVSKGYGGIEQHVGIYKQ